MKNFSIFLTAFLLSLCFGKSIQAEDSVRFNLAMDSLVPKLGVETVKTIYITEAFHNTNNIKGQQSITNSVLSLDLKVKDKTLIWDESSGYAKIEIMVDHNFYIYGDKTNELVKSGTRIVGTFIAGEWFFQSPKGQLSDNASQSLAKIFYIHPDRGIKYFDCLKLNQPRSVGESWGIETLPDLSNLNGLDYYTRFFAKKLNTNTIKSTARFVGATNVFGFNCFHLNQMSSIHEQIKGMDYSAEAKASLIVPFDTSIKSWIKSVSIDGCLTLKEMENTNAIPLCGGFSARMVMECRETIKK